MLSNAIRSTYASRLSRNRKRGMTLMELAMVLAVIAIVVATVMLYYTSANTSRLTTQALGQLAQVQTIVRSLYGGQSSFSGVANDDLIDSKSLPQSMISGATIRHAFNAPITVTPASAGGGANSGFQVVFDDVPQEACVAMLSKDLGRGVFSAGGPGGSRNQTTGLPFTPAQAAQSCSGTYNNMTWIFS
jgi:prepilin-type N-terminal cleavage/methylation domain-containing protein